MKFQVTKVYDGMVWGTLPLMGGLFYWEHTLRLLSSSHKLIQILILPIIFVWFYFWNTQAEYERLRHLSDGKGTETKFQYHLVTTLSLTDELNLRAAASTGRNLTVSKDKPEISILNDEMEHPFEVRYHVSNN